MCGKYQQTSESNELTTQNQFVHSAVYLYIPLIVRLPMSMIAFSLRLFKARPLSNSSFSSLILSMPWMLMFHMDKSTCKQNAMITMSATFYLTWYPAISSLIAIGSGISGSRRRGFNPIPYKAFSLPK